MYLIQRLFILSFISKSLCFSGLESISLKSRHKPLIFTMSKESYNPSEIIKGLTSKSQLGEEWTYNDFINNLHLNNVDSATFINKDNNIQQLVAIDHNYDGSIDSQNVHIIKSVFPELTNRITDELIKNNINFDVLDIYSNPVLGIIMNIFGAILLYGGLSFLLSNLFLNRMSGPPGFSGGNKNMLNPFNNEEVVENMDSVVFDDVAGCDEAKAELVEVVEFLKNPYKFKDAGAKIPKGILLDGPPGTGKTLLARAVAGEAQVSFIPACGSEFIEMYVGLGASRVRNLFEQAKKSSPCVIFIDEIDAIGRQRGTGLNAGNDEREQTLNQILSNMDGFDKNSDIIILGATNRADILDSALTRSGRFDRKITVPLPDIVGRDKILNVHLKNKNVEDNIDFNEISLLTSGFSGADLENLANEAAILSVRSNKTKIDRECILNAFEKITIGLPIMQETRDDNVVELVAYHEIGHTITALLFSEFFNVRKVTINSNRGGAGGYTLFTPEEKYYSFPTKKYMLANLIIALGGRAAEIVYCNNTKGLITSKNYMDNDIFINFDNLDITTGASNDLNQANSISRKFIDLFGINNNIGFTEPASESQPFLGRSLAIGNSNYVSEYTREEIDKHVGYLINFALRSAINIIMLNYDEFNNMAKDLIKERTLSNFDLQKYNITYIL